MHELVTDHLVVGIQSHAGAIALGHFEVARTLGQSAEHGADLRTQTLAQILQRCADGKTALRKGRLGATVNDLLEQLAHGGVDGVANEVGVQSLQNRLARENLRSHGSRVGHARATDGLDHSLLNDTVLNVEGQFAGSLLGRAPSHTVSKTRYVLDLLCYNPLAFLRDGSRFVVGALFYAAHLLHFV